MQIGNPPSGKKPRAQQHKSSAKSAAKADESKASAKGGRAPQSEAESFDEPRQRPARSYPQEVVRQVRRPRNQSVWEAFAPALMTSLPPVPAQGSADTKAPPLNELFFSSTPHSDKIRLDSAQMRAALGEDNVNKLLSACEDVEQMVSDAQGTGLRKMPFRASVLTATRSGFPLTLMGSMRIAGSFGKIRDCRLIFGDGRASVRGVVKEFRLEEPSSTRMLDGVMVDKGPTDRLGGNRTHVSTMEQVVEEYRLATANGYGFPCHGMTVAGNKAYLAFEASDGDLMDVAMAATPIQARALARWVGESYAGHLALMHAHGQIHCDGKFENTGLSLDDGTFALIDFGGVVACDRHSGVATEAPKALTLAAPEMLLFKHLTTKQDVWCMGIVLLQCLGMHNELFMVDPSPLFRPASARNEQIQRNNRLEMDAFANYRRFVMEGGGGAFGINMERLAQGDGSAHAQVIAPAVANDAQTTAYIVSRLLDPNPKTRDTSKAAYKVLCELNNDEQDHEHLRTLMAGVAQQTDYMRQPDRIITKLMGIIEQMDATAFAMPQAP